jgi:hypothetical protein
MKTLHFTMMMLLFTLCMSRAQSKAIDYYTWSPGTYTVSILSEYDDDGSILIQLNDAASNRYDLWMPKTEITNLAMLMAAKASGMKIKVAGDVAAVSLRKYTQESTQIVASRLKKLRIE